MAVTSRINRKVHVRFCGRLEVKFLRPTHLIFREDARRLVKDNAPQNFSLPTKMALHLLRQDTSDLKKRHATQAQSDWLGR